MLRVFEVTISILALSTSSWFMWQWWYYLNSPSYRGEGSLWFVPAGYLVEVVLLSAFALFCLLKTDSDTSWIPKLWFPIGALLVIILLGGFSIGPSVIPGTIGFAFVAILISSKKREMVKHSLLMLCSGVATQVALMFILIKI